MLLEISQILLIRYRHKVEKRLNKLLRAKHKNINKYLRKQQQESTNFSKMFYKSWSPVQHPRKRRRQQQHRIIVNRQHQNQQVLKKIVKKQQYLWTKISLRRAHLMREAAVTSETVTPVIIIHAHLFVS